MCFVSGNQELSKKENREVMAEYYLGMKKHFPAIAKITIKSFIGMTLRRVPNLAPKAEVYANAMSQNIQPAIETAQKKIGAGADENWSEMDKDKDGRWNGRGSTCPHRVEMCLPSESEL